MIIDHIPRDTAHNRRPGLAMTAQHITIHSTGNERSTARHERAWLVNPTNDRQASWHIVVDERQAIEAIPLNEVAWHAEDGRDGPGNRTTIAIEICESGDRAMTLAHAAQVVADLLRARGWGIDRLRRHYDWSPKKKTCPRIFAANNWAGWEQFKRDVARHLNPPLPTVTGLAPIILRGQQLDVRAPLIEGRAFVPLRLLGEMLGVRVDWRDGKVHVG